jgi:O-antigen ligase
MSAWPVRLARAGRSLPAGATAERGRLGSQLIACLGAALLVRVLTDDLSSPFSHHSGSLNLSGAIALALILAAIVAVSRERRGMRVAALASSWLVVWSAVAVSTRGASAETLREGVREGSVLALALLLYQARATMTVARSARLLTAVALIPALIATYQLATRTGMDVEGVFRANGTLAHPNSAAMFFAISATAALWLYLDNGRKALDAALLAIFLAAVLATFSIDGTASLLAMLTCFGLLRRGPTRERLVPFGLAAVLAIAFFATPVGAARLDRESSTSLASAERKAANSSLAWRLYKWKSLIPEWERSPILGRGLGTTITSEGTPANKLPWEPPHSEYVRYLVETGLLGATILLAALFLLTRGLLRVWRTASSSARGARNAAAAAIAVLVGCLVNSLADNTLLNSPTDYAATLIVVSALSMPVVHARRARRALATRP